MCETEIKIAYIKKNVYKERKETTHVEVGEEKHTSSSSYIWKIKYNVCNKMVTRPMYKRLKLLKRKKSTYKPHYIPQTYAHSP